MALLHLTKVAVGCADYDALGARMAERAEAGIAPIVTRYRPTRHAELIGGSIFWIIRHRLVARQEIIGFADSEDRRCLIQLAARLVPVRGHPRRAHQGWRYLTGPDAPEDFNGGAALTEMPRALIDELAELALL